jgi:hypothetical protein
MTEQQTHLKNIIEQQKSLISEINELNSNLSIKKENFTKLQGIAEYLTSLGVSLDESKDISEEEIEKNVPE